jgi:hypothetical protein
VIARRAALGLLAAGCAGVQPFVAETVVLPAGAFGGGLDPDVTAVNLAQYAFADPSRTYGKPVEAARACVAMIYLAGALNTSPRWANISATTQEQLLQGRTEVRDALGVPAGVPYQAVVDALLAATAALGANDPAAAQRALAPPTFVPGGAATLARLSNLPYMRLANVSTQRAANQMFEGRDDWF